MPTKDEIKSAALESKIFLGTFDPTDMDSWYGLTGPVHCYHDLNRVPHLLIAGHDGAGKSMLILNSYLTTAALDPESYTVVHIDSDGYGGHPFWEADSALDQVVRSMDEREKKLAEAGHKDWDELRGCVKDTENKIFLVIMDKLDYIIDDTDPRIDADWCASVTTSLTDIMRRGHSLGVHLIAATRRDTPRDWVYWERKIPPFSTTVAFLRYSRMPRAVWYEGRDIASPEFSVNAAVSGVFTEA